jgi:hypothetical protein
VAIFIRENICVYGMLQFGWFVACPEPNDYVCTLIWPKQQKIIIRLYFTCLRVGLMCAHIRLFVARLYLDISFCSVDAWTIQEISTLMYSINLYVEHYAIIDVSPPCTNCCLVDKI